MLELHHRHLHDQQHHHQLIPKLRLPIKALRSSTNSPNPNQQFRFPLLTWEEPYRSDICSELNVEKYQLRKDGDIGYSHSNGAHDATQSKK